MSMELIGAFAVAAAIYALAGHVFERLLPPPPFFALVGALIWLGLGSHLPEPGEMLAESTLALTLAIVLFADASVVRLGGGRELWSIHLRLLLVGMPLTILVAFALGAPLAAIGGWSALLVAGILAPTDAALVDPVIQDDRVPEHLRTSLVVEAGLNDGLATPVIALAAAAVGVSSVLEAPDSPIDSIWSILLGAIVGAVLGGGFGGVLRRAERRGWASRHWEPVSLFGIAGLAYLAAEEAGGIALVSVFVAGGAWHYAAPAISQRTGDFTLQFAHMLSAIVFTWFGMVAVDYLPSRITLGSVLFALGVLLLARPVSVWLATIGTDLGRGARLLLGWYGPRGLASVLFLALLAEGDDLPHAVRVPVMVTIVSSLLLHGVTAVLAPRLVGGASQPEQR